MVVPFHELDPMQVVWHGHYLKYFDVVRDRLFEEAGVDLGDWGRRHGYLFPVVRANTKFVYPLRYRDKFSCSVEVREVKRKIVLDFEIKRLEDGRVCARCRSEQVAVRTSDFAMEMLIPAEICRVLS